MVAEIESKWNKPNFGPGYPVGNIFWTTLLRSSEMEIFHRMFTVKWREKDYDRGDASQLNIWKLWISLVKSSDKTFMFPGYTKAFFDNFAIKVMFISIHNGVQCIRSIASLFIGALGNYVQINTS